MNGASRRKSTELLHVTLSTGDIRTSPLVDGYRLTASTRTGAPATARTAAGPWLAVQLLPALARDLDAAAWLGDAERCVAWCWLLRERLPA